MCAFLYLILCPSQKQILIRDTKRDFRDFLSPWGFRLKLEGLDYSLFQNSCQKGLGLKNKITLIFNWLRYMLWKPVGIMGEKSVTVTEV